MLPSPHLPGGKRKHRQGGAIRLDPQKYLGAAGLRITRAGGFYIAITLFLGFAAVNTGNNLLFLIVSVLLGFMAVSGVLGWQNIRGLSLRVDVPDEVYRGVDTFVTVRLKNRKRFLPSFLLRATIRGTAVDFLLLDRHGEETGALTLKFPERGTAVIESAEIRSPFPVNFFVRSTHIAINRPVTVFPAPLPCSLAEGTGRTSDTGQLQSSTKGYEGEISKIADYTGGEPLKLIHWRLSARHQALKVKELTATAREPVILDVDTLPGANLETHLSCASYLVNRLSRANRPVGLQLRGRVIAPACSRPHRLRLLTELALYDQD